MKRLVGVVAALALIILIAAPAALAAGPEHPRSGRVLISIGGDVTLAAAEQADVVLVVGGTATVAGEARTVVAIDGAARLTGSTVETVVAVRSPVSVGAGATVTGDVLTVGSDVQRAGGGQILGNSRDVTGDLAALGFVLGTALLLLYLGFALATLVAGLLLAALAARQVRAAEALISHEPLTVLAAAILGLIVPGLVAFAAIATVVGAPLGFGVLFGLWPLAAFVGYLVAGIWIGDWILQRTSPAQHRGRPYLAAVIGLLVLMVIGLIPLLSFVASLFGFGAVMLLGWRTFRGTPEAPAATLRQAPIPVG